MYSWITSGHFLPSDHNRLPTPNGPRILLSPWTWTPLLARVKEEAVKGKEKARKESPTKDSLVILMTTILDLPTTEKAKANLSLPKVLLVSPGLQKVQARVPTSLPRHAAKAYAHLERANHFTAHGAGVLVILLTVATPPLNPATFTPTLMRTTTTTTRRKLTTTTGGTGTKRIRKIRSSRNSTMTTPGMTTTTQCGIRTGQTCHMGWNNHWKRRQSLILVQQPHPAWHRHS